MIKKHNAPEGLTINELNVHSVDRSKKDISVWRNALTSAESIYYPNRTRLYDLYADVILDGHLSGIIAKRMDAVLNKELYFEVGGKKVHTFDKLINSMEFRNVLRAILETQLWGLSGIEFLPGTTFSYELIPRKHIKPELGLITYEQSGTDGIAYEGMDNIWVMGEKRDLGLLLRCAPYTLYKRGGLGDWAEYIELFGQPIRIIKYDSYDEQTKQELKKVLEEAGSSLSLMIPSQADFELKDGKQANCDGNLQLSFIKALNEEMSIIILGNTETTTSAYSTGYAQSKVHLEQQYEITRSDITYAAAMLNSPKFQSVLAGYGYDVQGGCFTFSKDMDIDYLGKRIAIDKEVAQKVAIPDDYWYDTYGINTTA